MCYFQKSWIIFFSFDCISGGFSIPDCFFIVVCNICKSRVNISALLLHIIEWVCWVLTVCSFSQCAFSVMCLFFLSILYHFRILTDVLLMYYKCLLRGMKRDIYNFCLSIFIVFNWTYNSFSFKMLWYSF